MKQQYTCLTPQKPLEICSLVCWTELHTLLTPANSLYCYVFVISHVCSTILHCLITNTQGF